jgi:hypothetical protein
MKRELRHAIHEWGVAEEKVWTQIRKLKDFGQECMCDTGLNEVVNLEGEFMRMERYCCDCGGWIEVTD